MRTERNASGGSRYFRIIICTFGREFNGYIIKELIQCM